MFARLSDRERRAAESGTSGSESDDPAPIIPVPIDAPDPDWSWLRPPKAKGEPVGTWIYRTADGAVAFHVVRWKNVDPQGRKIIRPVSWIGDAWALRVMPAPRPLYNLPDIRAFASKPVVVVEGEKCADAATLVFPDCVVTTWAGGADARSETNWEPLAGREVLLVADADRPGHVAMRKLAEHLAPKGCNVRLSLPAGDNSYDIADAVEQQGLKGRRERIEAGAIPWKPAASATPDAKGNATWQTELIERLKSGDLDAIAEPETTAKMRALQESNRLSVELLRAKLLAIPKVRVALLDAAFGTKRGAGNGAELQGQLVEWPEVVPWPEAVDCPALLAEIARLFRHYVSLPNGGAEALALWSLYDWVFEAFAVCPNLMVTAPERESGKTRVTELLSWTVPRPKPVSDASAAAIIRGIERNRPTLIFDEAQHFLRRRPEDPIRGILLASFNRRFAFVDRCEGDDHEPRSYSTFAPKAMNGRKLAALDDMLTSRSVVIPMTRARRRYPDLRADRDPVGDDLRRKCARWRDDNMTALSDADPEMGSLFGRIADVWRPLYAVADAAGGGWPQLARHAALSLASQTNAIASGDTIGVQLLRDIRQIFQDHADPEWLTTADLDHTLHIMPERPWETLSNGKPMTSQKRGKMLTDYGIHTTKVRDGERTRNVYLISAFESAWEAWL